MANFGRVDFHAADLRSLLGWDWETLDWASFGVTYLASILSPLLPTDRINKNLKVTASAQLHLSCDPEGLNTLFATTIPTTAATAKQVWTRWRLFQAVFGFGALSQFLNFFSKGVSDEGMMTG